MKYKNLNNGNPLFIRYSNRKLYNVAANSYMNACEVLRLYQANPLTRVLAHKTMKDVTKDVILRAAIEDEKLSTYLFNRIV